MENLSCHKDWWGPVEKRLAAFDALPDDAFTVPEAMEILQISYRTLRRRMKENKRFCRKEKRYVQFGDKSIILKLVNVLTRGFVRRLLERQGLCSKGHRLTYKACYMHWRKDLDRYEAICMECRNDKGKEKRRKAREQRADWTAKPLPPGYARAS